MTAALPTHADVAAAIAPFASAGSPFELTDAGFCGRRSQIENDGFRAIETLLAATGRPVWTFDFNHAPADLAENVHDGDRFAADYRGATGAAGGTVFRVDHHYDVAALKRDSTTPMVRRWLLGLHDAGETALLKTIASGRYLTNHWDVDIMFSQHLASRATDRSYLDRVGRFLAAAALRNDYVEPPPAEDEPWASRAFYAGLGLEDAITAGEVTYAEAQSKWIPALGAWILSGERADANGDDPAVATLKAWADDAERDERRGLDRIAAWAEQGLLVVEQGGAFVRLDAPEKIDNAVLYLYVKLRVPGPRNRVQLLAYPYEDRDTVQYKVRAHGDVNLNPLYASLNERLPEAGFGGRAAAGGSRPVLPNHDIVRDAVRSLVAR